MRLRTHLPALAPLWSRYTATDIGLALKTGLPIALIGAAVTGLLNPLLP